MIGYLSGVLRARQAQELLVDVQGVGYEVQVSLNTWFDLPESGQPVALYTHFVVREDAQQLFGFGTLAERDLFRELIRVSGVGPRLALAVLSGMTVAEFVRCVQAGELAPLVRLPGVGRKTAERLLVELRDRLAGWLVAAPVPAHDAGADLTGEAESALIALGYKPAEAARMVAAAQEAVGTGADSAALIRAALRAVVKN
ncbi:MAG: Holliday junction branch migration protein RuvA [Pseudomonadales bacterium]|nr:Holliday junction branch migration protein RuvA [Pseudomonadales bacterium]